LEQDDGALKAEEILSRSGHAGEQQRTILHCNKRINNRLDGLRAAHRAIVRLRILRAAVRVREAGGKHHEDKSHHAAQQENLVSSQAATH